MSSTRPHFDVTATGTPTGWDVHVSRGFPAFSLTAAEGPTPEAIEDAARDLIASIARIPMDSFDIALTVKEEPPQCP